MALSVTHVSGTVAGDVEVRFTQDGIAVCRFRLTETPTPWDAVTQKWRALEPIPYICTAWRDLATNATESLVEESTSWSRDASPGSRTTPST
jgi:single-strand DNA-binding protein